MNPLYFVSGEYFSIGKLERWSWYIFPPEGRKHLIGKWYWRTGK